MLDNIKAGIYFGANKADFANYLRELYGTGKVKNPAIFPKYHVYTLKIYKDFDAVEAINKAIVKGHASMRVRILYFPQEERVYLTLKNSVRKWYYGANSLQDFCKTDLEDCAELIASKLCISTEFFRDFRNYQLELGLTTEHDKNFSLFPLSIIEHKYIKRQLRVDNETVSFLGDNCTLSCYDKGAEIENKKSLKEKLNLPDDKFYLRSEIKITKVSGVKTACENFRTFGDLIDNYEETYNYLVKQLQYINFIDCISPSVTQYLLSQKESRSDDKNKNKDFHDFIRFLGLEYIGFVKFNQMAKIFTNRPSKQLKTYTEIEERFRLLQKTTYRRIFFQKIKEKKKDIIK